MNLRNFANKTVNFIADRLKELIGLTLSIISVLIAISLLSYSPEDPNFIYSEKCFRLSRKLCFRFIVSVLRSYFYSIMLNNFFYRNKCN